MGGTRRSNRGFVAGVCFVVASLVLVVVSPPVAFASTRSKLAAWTDVYVAVYTKFGIDYSLFEGAMSTNNPAKVATVCGKYQALGYQLSDAAGPPDSALASLAATAWAGLFTAGTDCFDLAVSPTNATAKRFRNSLSVWLTLASRIKARLKVLEKKYG